MTEVLLVHEKSGADICHMWTSLASDGSLKISGQDIGPKVERFFGTDEYEFSHTVPVAFLEAFFFLRQVEIFDDPPEEIKQFSRKNYEILSEAF